MKDGIKNNKEYYVYIIRCEDNSIFLAVFTKSSSIVTLLILLFSVFPETAPISLLSPTTSSICKEGEHQQRMIEYFQQNMAQKQWN